MTPERRKEIDVWLRNTDGLTAFVRAADMLRDCLRDIDAKQAKIDSLMLEYCHDGMTPEQVADQWPSDDAIHATCYLMGLSHPITVKMIRALDEQRRELRERAEKAEQLADKFKWQVRDTCARAEKAEADNTRNVLRSAAEKSKLERELAEARAECERLRATLNKIRADIDNPARRA